MVQRATSTNTVAAATVAASLGGSHAENQKRQKCVVWPEFSDSDINSEKWDVTHKSKEKEKSKSPVVQHFYDDPDGKLQLPNSLRVTHWKRPQDFIADKVPTVIDVDGMQDFDLMADSDVAHESELMRWITSQIDALWTLCKTTSTSADPADPYLLPDGTLYTWRPWEHIYSLTKVGRGPHIPQFNPSGKYCVRLFWMGSWRKITIDDTIPFDENDKMLLPATTLHHQLWSMLLSKALIKVASLDYRGGNPANEFGDFNVIQCLTGWLPEIITLQGSPRQEVWELLKASVDDFIIPELEKVEDGPKSIPELKDERCDTQQASRDKADKGKDAKKETKKDSKEKSAKDKGKEKSTYEESVHDSRQVVAFASFEGALPYPVKVSKLAEMADSSERLRQQGLSSLHTHPLLISRTRSCPLDPPPVKEIVPAWKLIRPRKPKTMPTDEPQEAVVEKPIMCVEVTSPFINYKVSPVPMPSDIQRPMSRSPTLRGGSLLTPPSISENYEYEPEAPPVESPPIARLPTPPVVSKQTEEISTPPAPSKKRESNKSHRESIAQSKSDILPKDLKTKQSVLDKSPRGSIITEASPRSTDQAATDTIVPEVKQKTIWFDFDNFCKCFKYLTLYHKPNAYQSNANHNDLKSTSIEERTPLYLFVDNLKPSEIVVSFSSLSYWPEPPPSTKDTHEKLKSRGDKSDIERSPSQTGSMSVVEDDSQSLRDGSNFKEPALVPGNLTFEPHSWKTLVTGQPVLRIKTTGTRAAMMTLPPGRHVLKLSLTSPLGHHVHLSSNTQFVFGDEEVVLQHLVKESCRFVDNSVQVMSAIGRCIQVFNDETALKQAWQELIKLHCPYIDNPKYSKMHHFHVFNDALYATLRKALDNNCTAEMAYAWRVFLSDYTTKNPLQITYGQSRPTTAAASHRGSAKPGKKQSGAAAASNPLVPTDSDIAASRKDPTPEEQVAAVKLQRSWRGFWTRKAISAHFPGSEINQEVHEQLLKAWTLLEQKLEENGLFLFRTLFRNDPDLMQLYPFYKDEWNKISFADYQGTFPEQPPSIWFVVFREVFFVQEETLVVPKLHILLPTCRLRVVNNDTGTEMPKVFQKVAPHVYTKNKLGYTFIADAVAPEAGVPTGKWRMRLIGALSPLPSPIKNEVNCSFNMREIRDYYVPNKLHTIFRYSVRALDDHLASLQVQTSKPDVYVRLAILDNKSEVLTSTGKGHVVLPAYLFSKDPSDEEGRSSRTSGLKKDEKPVATSPGRKKRGDSGKSDGRVSQTSVSSESPAESTEELRPHNYIIEATVLRDSWPLSASSWAFVATLQEAEKNERKLDNPNRERPTSAPKPEKVTPPKTKPKEKGKGSKDKDKKATDSSRPPSQQFDVAKPHWILRFVSDAANSDDVDVKKDTGRTDEILAMKKAWEDAEPGRAAKGIQSRLQYLNAHEIKPEEDEVEAIILAEPTSGTDLSEEPPTSQTPSQVLVPELDSSDSVLTLEPPSPPTPKTLLPEIDITPFLREIYGYLVYKDDEETARQMAAHEEKIQDYRQFREQVEHWRENDRKSRNDTKVKQLDKFEEFQALLDQKRKDIMTPREALRQKYFEAERLRLEEIAVQEAAMKADVEAAAPSPKGGRKSAKGKKSPPAKKKK